MQWAIKKTTLMLIFCSKHFSLSTVIATWHSNIKLRLISVIIYNKCQVTLLWMLHAGWVSASLNYCLIKLCIFLWCVPAWIPLSTKQCHEWHDQSSYVSLRIFVLRVSVGVDCLRLDLIMMHFLIGEDGFNRHVCLFHEYCRNVTVLRHLPSHVIWLIDSKVIKENRWCHSINWSKTIVA